MAKDKISDYSSTANSNTDIAGINIDEGCAPSGINDAIRTLMAQLKNFQTGTGGDSFNGPVGSTTASTGAFTTLSASGVATFSDGTASAPALTNDGDTNTGIFFPAADTVGISTGGTERARVDSAGNLGLGVTPSAWVSTWRALDISTYTSVYGASGNTSGFSQNAYYNGTNWIYRNTNAASNYIQSGGQHEWHRAASGTAGNTISFTQAMTLNASGQLIVNDTSAGTAKMKVVQSGDNTTAWFTNGSLGTTNPVLFLENYQAGSDSKNLIAGDNNTGTVFKVTTNGGGYYAGNLLVGTTSNSGSHRFISVISNSGNSSAISAVNGSTASSGVSAMSTSLGTGNAGNTNCYHLRATTENVAIYYLYGNGTTSFSSDQRLKKNIETARNGYVDDLCKLRVVKYHWNANEDSSPKELGLIAQEVEQVFPGLVQDSGETVGEVENTKVLKNSVLPFMLLKAIQEQQAIIETLTARITALEQA